MGGADINSKIPPTPKCKWETDRKTDRRTDRRIDGPQYGQVDGLKKKPPNRLGVEYNFEENGLRRTGVKENKAGYTATEVACGWAGAIF